LRWNIPDINPIPTGFFPNNSCVDKIKVLTHKENEMIGNQTRKLIERVGKNINYLTPQRLISLFDE